MSSELKVEAGLFFLRYLFSLNSSQWQPSPGDNPDEFTTLLDYVASGDYMFILLGKPNSMGGLSEYKIRSLNIATGDLVDVDEARSRFPLSFHGVSDQGLLMWQFREGLKVSLKAPASGIQNDIHQCSPLTLGLVFLWKLWVLYLRR